MRDTRTILLASLSVGLVATWVYHLYDKTQYAKTAGQPRTAITKTEDRSLQDSLQSVYSRTVNDLSVQLDSVRNTAGLLQGELIAKLDEINRLKTEIADLLKNKNANREDLDLAGKKTAQFQQLVARLPKNKTVAPENNATTPPIATVPVDNNAIKPAETTPLQNEAAPLFVASDIKLLSTNDREEETNLAESTSQLVISLAVKNNVSDFNNAELFAVVTQPDGHVVQTDPWESSSISTHGYGRKLYTRKLRFEYQKGEIKKLQLTVKPEDYERGSYRLQVFHNGYLIGETSRKLD